MTPQKVLMKKWDGIQTLQIPVLLGRSNGA